MHYRYNIIQSCWTEDPQCRPSFKLLASQWENLLGNNVKYLQLDHMAVSNPLYCSHRQTEKFTMDETSFQQADNLDHLWIPPQRCSTMFDQMDRKQSTQISVLLGYDIPRTLIDTKTIEQNLRYQNDLSAPRMKKIQSADDFQLDNVRNNMIALSHYDKPKRRKSYLDMTGIIGVCSYNLDVMNKDKKNMSKDIPLRFSSLLNLNTAIGN